jgi:predicted nuclease of restriction endonuclease-like (RecB) superfamily
VQQMVKDPYNFEFLTLAANAAERDVESGLVANRNSALVFSTWGDNIEWC